MILTVLTVLLAALVHGGAAQGTDLGNGVVTRVNVDYLADLSLDVRDMRQFLKDTDGIQDALDVYLNGRNAEKRKSFKYPLQKLSQELATEGVSGTPNYVFHLYGLSDLSTDIPALNQNALYADNFIQQAIQAGGDLGPDAILVLSMWMYATHLLMDGFDVCSKMTLADNSAMFKLNGGGMDEFIAMWIGSDQDHSLYGLSQNIGAYFGQVGPETNANTKIKLLYQQGAALLSVDKICSRDTPDSPRQLWNIAQQIISQMQIPIMQTLIRAIAQEDEMAVQLYALAVVPQIAQCRPSLFNRLKENLLIGVPNFARKRSILEDLQEAYSCLGFTCEELGEYTGSDLDEVPTCPNPSIQPAMAQYNPTSAVHPVSRIDLDVLQMRILTSLERYRFAKHLYEFGRNSPTQRDSQSDPFQYYSLGDFAVSASRRNADPIYTAFIEYHNDPNYADTMIRNALDGRDKWASSVVQRTAVVAETAAFHVLFMHALAQMNDAIASCENGEETGEYDLTHPWDEVAALLIGSLEGPKEGGSPHAEDGQLIWNLANSRAFQFQTMNDKGYSAVCSRLEDLLFAGRGELDAQNCRMLRRTVKQIQGEVLIPLLQSVIRYAMDNENLSSTSDRESLALGEVYAMALVPIVGMKDGNIANIIQENMVVQDGVPPVREGVQTVASAVGEAARNAGVGCKALGTTSQVDPCDGVDGSDSSVLLSTTTACIFSTAALVGALAVAW